MKKVLIKIENKSFLELWNKGFVIGFTGDEEIINQLYKLMSNVETRDKSVVILKELEVKDEIKEKPKVKEPPVKLTEEVLDLLGDGKEYTHSEIASKLGRSHSGTHTALTRLLEKGKIERRSKKLKKGGKMFYYKISTYDFKKAANEERKVLRDVLG